MLKSYDVLGFHVQEDGTLIECSEIGGKKSFSCVYGDDLDMIIPAIKHKSAIVIKRHNIIAIMGFDDPDDAMKAFMSIDAEKYNIDSNDITFIRNTEKYCINYNRL